MQKYPTLKVIITYPLLGGVIGSFLVLPFIIADLSFLGVIYVMVFGWIIGLIPALLTGVVLAYFKIRILTTMDYLKAFGIGFGVAFLLCFGLSIASVFRNFDNVITWVISPFLSSLLPCVFLALIGGISSAILATFILPNSQKTCPNPKFLR